MTDEELIEAMHDAYMLTPTTPNWRRDCFAAALAVAAPVIRARALEEAALAARNILAYADTTSEADKEVVAAIRALAEEKKA